MEIKRFAENPLITPNDVKPTRDDFEVICVFNPGVAKYGDETLLLMRVAERPKSENPHVTKVPLMVLRDKTPFIEIHEWSRDNLACDFSDPRIIQTPDGPYLTSISHLRLARSKDGRIFSVDEHPAIIPDRESEAFGIEDARITEIDGTYYIVYKSVSTRGITQSLATTRDFINFDKHGIILAPENMDAMIFPEKIDGKFVALHRPFPHMIGEANMWLAHSDDAVFWGDHRFLAGVMPGGWECGRIGGSAVPFKTEHGWLEIYHGATPDNVYSLGAMLLDLEKPEKVIARSSEPIIMPEAIYEVNGFVPNVVFSCGAVVEGDKLTVYYGGADTVIGGAELSVSKILDSMVNI